MKKSIIIIFVLIISILPALKAYSWQHDLIIIRLSSKKLELYKRGKLFRSYPVGVGKKDYPTPTGIYKVISKDLDPAWEHPFKPPGELRIESGNESPLGTRWIGFNLTEENEYGIHGTYVLDSVGKASSHGCVRMYNKDVEELYDNVELGTPVIVTNSKVDNIENILRPVKISFPCQKNRKVKTYIKFKQDKLYNMKSF